MNIKERLDILRVTVIQPDLIWENKLANFSNITELVSPLYHKTDIVILPEMFNSGFSMNIEKLSESTYGETLEWMKRIAESGNFGLCGSFIVKERGHFFNRWVFVTPENEYWIYDKRHLFAFAGEEKYFTRGRTRVIFSFRGVRICPCICYDLRFPVWSRNRGDYDLLIYAANWPKSRRDVWSVLLKARAIENQCYVAGSNRVGTDGADIKYCGDSMIVNPRGEVIASARPDEESIVTAEISMSELSDFRKNFAVLNDADDFSIDF